jgi:hypothetical protein
MASAPDLLRQRFGPAAVDLGVVGFGEVTPQEREILE